MDPLYLVAVIKPKAEGAATVREFLDSMIAATRDEDGCEMYDLVVGDDDPSTWLMIEKWSSRAHWDAMRPWPASCASRPSCASTQRSSPRDHDRRIHVRGAPG